jgi:hypothetical protein
MCTYSTIELISVPIPIRVYITGSTDHFVLRKVGGLTVKKEVRQSVFTLFRFYDLRFLHISRDTIQVTWLNPLYTGIIWTENEKRCDETV